MIIINLKSLLDKARQLLGVDGGYVGIVGETGDFFELALQLIQIGNKKDFINLLEEENPVSRAMGIVCLVRTEGIKCKDVIMPHLKDRSSILLMPGGCTLLKTTLGRLVWEFFNNINYLGFDVEEKPLLPERELISFNLNVLINDQYTSFHWKASRKLDDVIKNESLLLRLSNLKNVAPSLSVEDLLKGIGRIEGNENIRKFLRKMLNNKGLSVNERLAAGSALTRELNIQSFKLLTDLESFFNEKAENSGTYLLQLTHLRKKILDLVHYTFQENTEDWMEDHKKDFIDLISVPHPDALYYLRAYGLSFLDRYSEMREPLIECLFNLANLSPKFMHSWDTYSNFPYKIELFLYGPKKAEIEDMLGEQKYSEFTHLVKRHIRN